jgi:hypothetical protein
MPQIPSKKATDSFNLFNYHCIQLSHFPTSWKEEKVIALLKPVKDPKFPPNLSPISLLSTTGKLFEKVILKIIKRHIKGRDLLNATYEASGPHDPKL